MKKLTLLMLAGLIGLTACSSDDDDNKIKLNKLTKITCYKNDESTPYYQVDIFYNPDGTISYLQDAEKGRQDFIYVDKKLTVSGPGSEKAEYSLNNNFITQMKTYILNPYVENTVYINEEYSFSYKRDKLSSADKLLRWPTGNGLQYETRTYSGYDNYIWDINNISRFTQDTKEMVYEYTSDKQPDNLPLMVQNSFAPMEFEFFSPINFMRGALNNLLISRAYWYNVPNADVICAKYLFDYTFKNEYVTSIRIEETDYTVNMGGNNFYTIQLEYNFQN